MSKMLFPKMAVSNIRKNKKLYVPYIITAIFTVMMFFMNISIVKNKNVAAMRGGQTMGVVRKALNPQKGNNEIGRAHV